MFVGPIVTPYYLLFLHQVLHGYFETEHQFKQKAIIAETVGPLKGPVEGGSLQLRRFLWKQDRGSKMLMGLPDKREK